MANRAVIPLIVAMAATPVVSCGSARRGAPFVGEREPPNAKLVLGERVFDRECSQCHPGGEAGLGPSLNDKPLPQFAIRIQVRNGVGAMPRFPRETISSEELSAITSYMAWLRDQHR